MNYFKNCKTYYQAKYQGIFNRLLNNNRGEITLNQILGIAVALIIAAFVTIPALRTFSNTVLTSLTTWYNSTVSIKIFPTT